MLKVHFVRVGVFSLEVNHGSSLKIIGRIEKREHGSSLFLFSLVSGIVF